MAWDTVEEEYEPEEVTLDELWHLLKPDERRCAVADVKGGEKTYQRGGAKPYH